ncbi:hypothetical protein DCAR_0207889 [Daucus carota subsp. sativus]|uniref:Uncharacterized protein n=1 Tax=Daucus carota subsp. sativus TaxID=79200 RepID=A0A166E662_DAUCS|nr:hypothetical protein DCAR_0207889 [Daucus carota subsp. sativus]
MLVQFFLHPEISMGGGVNIWLWTGELFLGPHLVAGKSYYNESDISLKMHCHAHKAVISVVTEKCKLNIGSHENCSYW